MDPLATIESTIQAHGRHTGGTIGDRRAHRVWRAARLPWSRSRGDLHASGIRKNLHHGVGPQVPAFPIPASVKDCPNSPRDPPHAAVASDARCDRRGEPGKSIDYLTGKYRSGGTRIHVVDGHDNFVGRIVVNPDVELTIAESRRRRQRQRKAEHIDRSITSPTHSRYSKSQMAGALHGGRPGSRCLLLGFLSTALHLLRSNSAAADCAACRSGHMDPFAATEWIIQAHGRHTARDIGLFARGTRFPARAEPGTRLPIGEPGVSVERSLYIQAVQVRDRSK